MTRRIINTRMGRTMLMLLLAAALALAAFAVVAQPPGESNTVNGVDVVWTCVEYNDLNVCVRWDWRATAG